MPLGLFKKELRQLLPWAVAIWSTEVLGHLFGVMYQDPDTHVWAVSTPIFVGSAYAALFWACWALILAYAGFPRERDDGTLAFLFTLPVRRRNLFIAKACAGLSVLWVAVLIDELARWVLHLPNPTFFGGHTFRLDWAFASAGLTSAFAFIAFGYASFLAVLRRFGLLLGLFVATLIPWIKTTIPGVAWVNPQSVLEVSFYGTSPVIPWRALAIHGLSAALLAGIAGYFWVGPLDGWSERMARWLTSKLARAALVVGGVTLVVVFSVLYSDSFERSEATFGTLTELEGPEVELETRRYRFRYPEPLRARVEELARSADSLHDRVCAELSVQPGGAVIEVNLTRVSVSHAGSATWNTIRMDAHRMDDARELERTLAHETTHVTALRLSDRRIGDHGDAFRLFDEGLAEHLAWMLVPNTEGLAARWLEAVAFKERLRVRPDDFFTVESFRARFGEGALYPLGLSWVRALLDACGPKTAGGLLRALARPEAPKHLAGRDLWQDALQAIGCDLNRVVLRWDELMTREAAERRADLDRMPALVGGISHVEDDQIVLQAEVVGAGREACVFGLQTRDSEKEAYSDHLSFAAEESADGNLHFEIPTDFVSGEFLQFQLTESCLRAGIPVVLAEKWQRAKIPEENPHRSR